MSRSSGVLRWACLFGQCSFVCSALAIILFLPTESLGIVPSEEITVTKTAATSLDRTYTWTADIVSANPSVTLNVGESFDNNFTIYLDRSYADSNFYINGNITVRNNTDITQSVSLSDILDTGESVLASTFNIAPYDTWSHEYSYLSASNTATLNVVTAVVNGTDYSATAAVDFGSALIEFIDEAISVDSSFGDLGIFTDAATLSYDETFGPYGAPMTNNYLRFVSFRTNDTGFQGYDDVNFNVNVINPVPEPSTFILLGAGLAGLAAVGIRRKKS